VLPGALYVRATRILTRRGYRVPALQQVAWFGGLALMGVALLSPLDSLGETDLLSAHMAQHLLIADLSAPLLVIGLRSPVYAFILPRSLFATMARSRRLRATFTFLKQPLVAAPLWVLTLYGWHLAPAYEAALRSPVLHALQHQTFIAASLLVWVSVLEPARRRVPGELWKIAHIVGVRFSGMFLGMAFVILQTPIYEGFYGRRALDHGLTPAEDQQLAGGLMLAIDFLVMVGALVFFFLRAAEDADRAEQQEPARDLPPPVSRGEVKLG
jgi:cytochrome c oxidase assembly factor CtaG